MSDPGRRVEHLEQAEHDLSPGRLATVPWKSLCLIILGIKGLPYLRINLHQLLQVPTVMMNLYVLYGDCHACTETNIFGQIMCISMTVVNTYILN